MSVFCFLSGSDLNMMHLIMGIMVIGLSVDYGIFIVCATLSDMQSSSFRAVSICAASSLIGFGVLAFAGHPALHALGVTVLVGIGTAWPTAILVSPSLLAVTQRRE
jgi:predicted exporter